MKEPTIKLYYQLHEKYLKAAEKEYQDGELSQAGEKYWGALCTLLNLIGEAKGMRHYTHRDYNLIINTLWKELKNPEIPRLFTSAERLHANYYHNFLDKETFELHREDTLKLINILKEYITSKRYI